MAKRRPMNQYPNPTTYTADQLAQVERSELIKIILQQQQYIATEYELLKEVYTELEAIRKQQNQQQEQSGYSEYHQLDQQDRLYPVAGKPAPAFSRTHQAIIPA